MSKFAQLWYWRNGSLNDRWARVESFVTDEHPKSTTIVGGERPSATPAFSWTEMDNSGHLLVGMIHDHLPNTPALWWILREENNGIVPTASLIAFADDRYVDGTILSVEQARSELDSPPVQVGAIRWGRGNPKLEQIYTAPEYRRRRVSIKMIHTADIINEAACWGGYLYGGEELTSDGEQLASAWAGSHRLREQSVHASPMEYL